jgi:demethylmenaquinone methyltransferase/2-methoxy-6-polyprenyl-1,4-benzoquinol methylase
MRRIVPTIARVFGGTAGVRDLWRYFWDSIEACMPPAQVLAALREAGFADVRRDVELGIFNAYVGRRSD